MLENKGCMDTSDYVIEQIIYKFTIIVFVLYHGRCCPAKSLQSLFLELERISKCLLKFILKLT